MAIYDYHCQANGKTVEVRHRMSESLDTWGDLCERAGIEPEGTPLDAPIERKISAGVPLTGRSSDSPRPGPGSACCGGSCGCA